ncbi:hypothetical protein SAMN04488550_0140 [Gordonia malaquae]|uniref:Knr4/Smi1-like domain-containing protein n=2 Tax=Gordonia TaxID=2053 RepID=M3UZR9_GORML|nr:MULTISPECIES: SMI1/KNR4 family protein [Gordonia]GAC81532.1 hypothetical protein GM1_037_00030 [Gordonia malaquae NBRC 108250]GEE00595.1 hypothetical protein nbrc107696_10410 [Gordonia spumicola]SEB48878.1 hypothetical protein SAMN04488550_0140 [Gordonia malaquae]
MTDWHALIDAQVECHNQLVSLGLYPPTVVGAPASEGSIRAAENRIGYRIDSGYREFLSIASGWRQQQGFWNLFSADELGGEILIEAPDPTQPMFRMPWAEAIALREHSWGIGIAGLTYPPEITDWEEVIPVGGTDGLGGDIYMLCTPHDEPARPPGPIFVITSGFVERHETFAEYLEAGIDKDRGNIADPSLWGGGTGGSENR